MGMKPLDCDHVVAEFSASHPGYPQGRLSQLTMRGTSKVECPKCGAPMAALQERFADRETLPLSCTVDCPECGVSVGLNVFGGVSLARDDEDTRPNIRVEARYVATIEDRRTKTRRSFAVMAYSLNAARRRLRAQLGDDEQIVRIDEGRP